MFLDNVKSIVVHWSGSESAKTFRLLAKMPKLESLGIVISKLTFIHLNERAALMKTYFPLAFKTIRIADVLGLDELLEIRGLHQVGVMLAPTSRGGSQSYKMDRANLLELLSSRLTRAKEVSLRHAQFPVESSNLTIYRTKITTWSWHKEVVALVVFNGRDEHQIVSARLLTGLFFSFSFYLRLGRLFCSTYFNFLRVYVCSGPARGMGDKVQYQAR